MPMVRLGRYLILLALLVCPSLTWGQALPRQEEEPSFAMEPVAEVGRPFFFKHFTPREYRQHHQNWAVVQDQRGVIYVGNYNGILEYDGAAWRFIETATRTVVRSFAVDTDGVVYVGLKGDFGYLQPDSTGNLQYRSLRDEGILGDLDIDADEDVWGTHVTGEGVFFQTPNQLLRWDETEIKAWETEQGFHTSFVVRDQLYVREFDVGLLHMVDEGLQPVPEGERFADLRVYMMAPYATDDVLIATREAGLFLYDGASVTPFSTEVDGLLEEYRLYHGAALPGRLYALAMLDGGGVVVIDERGEIVQYLDESAGLEDWVNHVYADAQGGLWMALNNQGITRVDMPSSLSVFDRRRGLEGIIHGIERHRSKLYVATSTGLYVLLETPQTTQANHTIFAFEEVLGGTARTMLATDSLLFVATDEGLFAVDDTTPEQIIPGKVFALLESGLFDGQIFLGMKDGLALLRPTASGWTMTTRVGAVDKEIRSMEEADGALWMATVDGRVLRLQLSGDSTAFSLNWFSEEDGLPGGEVYLASRRRAPHR